MVGKIVGSVTGCAVVVVVALVVFGGMIQCGQWVMG